MSESRKSRSTEIGNLGEQLVCDRLQMLGWAIAARQWKCRRGELDIVAIRDRDLKFIEVKTRSNRNWDESGALAISVRKQQRLIVAAQLFLQVHPSYCNHNCSFDVALVAIGYRQQLRLRRYIEAAFEL
ncbi:MAG: YraN family protein [Synechococcus sp.]